MKAKIGVLTFSMLACAGMAFAVNGTGYYNLISVSKSSGYGSTTRYVLSQGNLPCTDDEWSLEHGGTTYYVKNGSIGYTTTLGFFPFSQGFQAVGSCIASGSDTPTHLYDILDTAWASKVGEGIYLELGSDIDLGEYNRETPTGDCEVNHIPLKTLNETQINGNGYTVSHLCYKTENPMTRPVGLFEQIENVSLSNLKINGVRIFVNTASNDGADFYPVGALAGVVKLALVDSIEIANDSIQAPVAGGLIGYLETATVQNVQGHDDIYITNQSQISTGYAGSAVVPPVVQDYKVFLGGIVGVANRTENQDPTFQNDSVKVSVIDFMTGHKSSLGGVAGFFSTTGETVDNLDVFTKYKENNEKVASLISGGSSMGGLFGAVYVSGEFSLTNSRFDGQLTNASSVDKIMIGGLIGMDSISAASQVPFKIQNSSANIKIEDVLQEPEMRSYYAGGILGYGSSCQNAADASSAFVTMSGLNTTGSISIGASAKSIPGIHGDFYLGGLAGSACFAQAEGMGLLNDTSSVEIVSRIKTAFDENRLANGFPSYDSVFVGGMVGDFNTAASTAENNISNLLYQGSITVRDSMSHLHVGGILGAFTMVQGSKSLRFENVKVNTDKVSVVFEGSKHAGSNLQTAKIGGICGLCKEIKTMHHVGFNGNLLASGTYWGDTLLVGGLVGSTSIMEGELDVNGVYVQGNIQVDDFPEVQGVGSTLFVKVGYVMGFVMTYRDYEIKSIYHYGESDAAVSMPVGYFYTGVDVAPGWKTNEKFKYVIRNAASLDLSETLDNGTVLADSMKKSSFAGMLNKAYDNVDDCAWSFAAGENNNLPIFVDDKHAPIQRQEDKFNVIFYDFNNQIVWQEYVTEGESVANPPDLPEIDGYECTKWDTPLTNIREDLTVKEVCTIKEFVVEFFDFNNHRIGPERQVTYLGSANPPPVPPRDGYNFVGWDDSSFVHVTQNLSIHALYKAKEYLISFIDFDDTLLASYKAEYGSAVAVPLDVTRPSTAEYVYTFKSWIPEVVPVSEAATYKAVYDSVKVKYAVIFLDADNQQIGDTAWVEYGSSAVAPKAPVRDGFEFQGWDHSFDKVVASIEVKALYEKNPESSSEMSSSSSVDEGSSSSSVNEGSSSVDEGSSSSSYEENPGEKGKIKIVDPLIEYYGNAVRLTFSAENTNASTVARVVVKGESGVLLDTVISKSVVEGGVWEMYPAPIGTFDVELLVGDDSLKATFKGSFEVPSEIVMPPKSWRMISLSAMDASFLKNVEKSSLFWWDEQNPIGDYWQYRSYNGEKVEATRGFWYGSSDGAPLVLRESSGNKSSEIVWELDNAYSGWNLVANPYGWRVDLTKGASDDGSKVTFWRWNTDSSNYGIPTVLEPYEAIWAKVDKAVTWRVSAAPVFNVVEKSSAKSALHKDRASIPGAWKLLATLADDNGKKDSWNIIGAGIEESLDEPPAGMGDRVSLAIREMGRNGEKGAKLAQSVKALADEYRWTFEMSASSARDGKLSFEGLSELNRLGLKLFVIADGKTTELRDGKSMNVALAKTTTQVEVRVASSNAVQAASKLGSLRSTVSGDQLNVQIDVPEGLAGAKAHYTVVGVDGKKIASGHFKASQGDNAIHVVAPRAGLYFVKVKVGSQEVSGKILKK